MNYQTLGTTSSNDPFDMLLNDRQVSAMLGFKVSYIRKQRYLRRKGLPHSFPVDAVLIGNNPRYRYSEIIDWMETL